MIDVAAMSRRSTRWILGFLMLLCSACEGGQLSTTPDANGPDCGTDGCGGDVCSLPFEIGPCEAAFTVYAHVDGACVRRTYGGCAGNGNRFSTAEECLATCAGQPLPGACPPNRIAREICLACGPAGGCAKMATVCALVCEPDAGVSPCEPALPTCYQGVCQNAFCF
jgi:hypothetical protein